MTVRRRLAILADFKEEGWPSMDLVAEMLSHQLSSSTIASVGGRLIEPGYRHLFARGPFLQNRGFAKNLDRFYNRFVTYPRLAKAMVAKYDFFHVADHSYAGLMHSLPPAQSGVYCHDLDAFRCLIEPDAEPRPWWFRKMARHILTGMQKAAVVFHSTGPVKEAILRHKLIDESKLVHAPYGVSAEFTGVPQDNETRPVDRGVPSFLNEQSVVHVGSCIPRKRIDVLLEMFAEVRQKKPDVKLIKVSGTFTSEHLKQISRLELGPSIVHLQGLSRSELATIYRSAAVVLVPSEFEGFGLPVIEALACGAPVIASDIPVLREVGGDSVSYCPVGNINQWVARTLDVLRNPDAAATRAVRLSHAATFSWENHARIIADAYGRLR